MIKFLNKFRGYVEKDGEIKGPKVTTLEVYHCGMQQISLIECGSIHDSLIYSMPQFQSPSLYACFLTYSMQQISLIEGDSYPYPCF